LFNDKENRFLLEFTLAKAGVEMTAAAAGKNYTLILLLLYGYCSYLLLLVWNFSTRGSGEFPLG